MSRKPVASTHHHDASAPNCEHHAAAVAAGEPARPERKCLRCFYVGTHRRRAVRA